MYKISDAAKHAPKAVIEAIRDAFPHDAYAILAELRFHEVGKFYSFNRWGMFVGIELDGYIHT